MAKRTYLSIDDLKKEYVRPETIAKMIGVSVRRVQQLTQEGIFKTEIPPDGSRGRKYPLADTILAYCEYIKAGEKTKSQADLEEKLKIQKLEAEIALKESQGELHQLKTRIASGEYMDIETVKMDYQKFFTVFKKFVAAMPVRILDMLSLEIEPSEERKTEKAIQAEINRMLETFVLSQTQEPEEKPKKAVKRKRGTKKVKKTDN